MTEVCCVEGCDAATKNDVTYFQFPIKPTLRRKWREAINPTAKLSTDAAVCSQHFASCDYETVRGRVRLKGKVVPTVFAKNRAKSPLQQSNDVTENGNFNHGDNVPENNNTDSQNNSEPAQNNSEGALNNSEEAHNNSEEAHNNSEDAHNNSEDAHTNSEDAPSIDCTDFMQVDFGYPLEHSVDENGEENCTIECAPEALITQDSDSNSELEIHKEDIEDIIANYHIEQNKLVADRLKAAQQKEAENEEKQKQEKRNQEARKDQEKNQEARKDQEKNQEARKDQEKKQEARKDQEKKQEARKEGRKREARKQESRKENVIDDDDSDDDVIEVLSKEPVFIEVSVGGSAKSAAQDDCLMLLEDVQVDIDPSSLMLPERESEADSGPPTREDPISLLTSSDEDDVIIQEPKIDTVEVSDEDEDDMPLVKLVKTREAQNTITKILWGSLYEYFCFECHFKTTSKSEFTRHKIQHSTVIQMCGVCNFTSGSKAQFARHKRKHKEEKRFKCHLCDYKAKHNMSLIYHLKSHGGMSIESVKDSAVKDSAVKVKKCFKCQKCKFQTKVKSEMLRHVRVCSGWTKAKVKLYSCDKCVYSTKRPSDLKRHIHRIHKDYEDEEEDYDPS